MSETAVLPLAPLQPFNSFLFQFLCPAEYLESAKSPPGVQYVAI